MIFVVLEEVLPHKLDKQFTNSCFHFDLVDHFRQLLNDCRWVITKGVDVKWCIVSTSERKVFLCGKVEGNI